MPLSPGRTYADFTVDTDFATAALLPNARHRATTGACGLLFAAKQMCAWTTRNNSLWQCALQGLPATALVLLACTALSFQQVSLQKQQAKIKDQVQTGKGRRLTAFKRLTCRARHPSTRGFKYSASQPLACLARWATQASQVAQASTALCYTYALNFQLRSTYQNPYDNVLPTHSQGYACALLPWRIRLLIAEACTLAHCYTACRGFPPGPGLWVTIVLQHAVGVLLPLACFRPRPISTARSATTPNNGCQKSLAQVASCDSEGQRQLGALSKGAISASQQTKVTNNCVLLPYNSVLGERLKVSGSALHKYALCFSQRLVHEAKIKSLCPYSMTETG